MITVRSNIKSITASLDELQRRKVPTATRQALNRVGITIRKKHRNNLSEELRPRRKGDVSKAVTLTKATRLKPYVRVTSNEKFLHLGQSKDARVQSYRKGKRRAQRVRFRGRIVEGAFRPKGLTTNTSIFRQTTGKYKTGNRRIKKLFAYSLLQELEKNRLHAKLNKPAAERFEIEFGRALANQLRRS
jgi:hypothetical protein